MLGGHLVPWLSKILWLQTSPPMNSIWSHIWFSMVISKALVSALQHYHAIYKGSTHLLLATHLPLNLWQLTFPFLGHLKPVYCKEIMICCKMMDDKWPMKSPHSLEIGTKSMKYFIRHHSILLAVTSEVTFRLLHYFHSWNVFQWCRKNSRLFRYKTKTVLPSSAHAREALIQLLEAGEFLYLVLRNSITSVCLCQQIYTNSMLSSLLTTPPGFYE